jgi:hypothetical protein
MYLVRIVSSAQLRFEIALSHFQPTALARKKPLKLQLVRSLDMTTKKYLSFDQGTKKRAIALAKCLAKNSDVSGIKVSGTIVSWFQLTTD